MVRATLILALVVALALAAAGCRDDEPRYEDAGERYDAAIKRVEDAKQELAAAERELADARRALEEKVERGPETAEEIQTPQPGGN